MPQKTENILITGGAGFIGSNFIPYFIEKYSDYRVINLDSLTYAGNLSNLEEIEGHPRYKFVKGDICDRELVRSIFQQYDIKGVINFAAESHVDNSILDPEIFIKTNVIGTQVLLDVACEYWLEKPFYYKESAQFFGGRVPRFHQISTDEVFGTLGEKGLFTELTPYAPNSPYSASKASGDMFVRAYKRTFGLNTVITNCSNNYGPKQHVEKLIPCVIHKALAFDKICIYGNGENIRDWLYVSDHCKGIDRVYHKGNAGETYNIGGGEEKTNNNVVNQICDLLDELCPISNPKLSGENKRAIEGITSYRDLITYVNDRPGHDKRYGIDAGKMEREFSWKPLESFENGIRKTIQWYLNKL